MEAGAGEPSADLKSEVARLRIALELKDQQIARMEEQLNKWNNATITLVGYEDAHYRGGTWTMNGSVHNGIAIPGLGQVKSDRGDEGNDRWSAIKVFVTVPS
ncbi:hypothetical protein BH11PLA1_BH11PLA1_18150 [soil metagenome]